MKQLAVRNTILTCLMVSLVWCSGCRLFDTGIPGSGTIQKKNYAVSPFTKVKISGIGSAVVSQGETESLTIETDDNLHEYLKVEVIDGELHIGQSESISPSDDLKISIVTKNIESFKLSGAGSAEFSGIKGEKLAITISGAGSLEGDGEVDELTIKLSGAGSADLKSFKSKTTNVKLSGAGSANVYASEKIVAKVSGVGSVTYSGNPKDVQKDVSGIGSVSAE